MKIQIIVLGLISLLLAYFVPALNWLVVTGFLFIFIGLYWAIAPYTVDGKKRAEKYEFRETTSEKNCKNCNCFDITLLTDFKGTVNIQNKN